MYIHTPFPLFFANYIKEFSLTVLYLTTPIAFSNTCSNTHIFRMKLKMFSRIENLSRFFPLGSDRRAELVLNLVLTLSHFFPLYQHKILDVCRDQKALIIPGLGRGQQPEECSWKYRRKKSNFADPGFLKNKYSLPFMSDHRRLESMWKQYRQQCLCLENPVTLFYSNTSPQIMSKWNNQQHSKKSTWQTKTHNISLCSTFRLKRSL